MPKPKLGFESVLIVRELQLYSIPSSGYLVQNQYTKPQLLDFQRILSKRVDSITSTLALDK